MTYDARYAAYKDMVEAALENYLDACCAPEPLLGAMRYSLLAGGKRLRPIMLLAACEMDGGSVDRAVPFACALEMIHTYSLIHDDLPAMDDDDMRRGRPTNHKVFGEGMAILAGDGLLSLAFEVALDAVHTPGEIQAMGYIARAAGTQGMVGGQCVDITCEKERMGGADELLYIHLHKTADMFIGAMGAGLALAGAAQERIDAGMAYGRGLGLAFQICDDLLDIEGDAAVLGKQTGMDATHGKLTWPGLFGPQDARHALAEQTEAALSALLPFGAAGNFLREMATRLLGRDR